MSLLNPDVRRSFQQRARSSLLSSSPKKKMQKKRAKRKSPSLSEHYEMKSMSLGKNKGNDLFDALELIKFPKRQKWYKDSRKKNGRVRATRTDQKAMAIGLTCAYSTNVPVVGPKTRLRGMQDVLDNIKGIMDKTRTNFPYTTIQINRDFPGTLHIDRGNVGPSAMLVVGSDDLSGGELWYEGQAHETANRVSFFDGNRPHMTLAHEGVRYSIVLFTTRKYPNATSDTMQTLRDLGIPARENDLPVFEDRKRAKRNDLLDDASDIIRKQVKDGVLPSSILAKLKGRRA